MPRVVLVPGTEYKKELPSIIRAKKGYFGLDEDELAASVGVSERTMHNRYRQPELFTLDQLYKLCKRLKIEIVINESGVHCRMEKG